MNNEEAATVEAGMKFTYNAWGISGTAVALVPTGFTHPEFGAFWRCEATEELQEQLKAAGLEPLDSPFVYPADFILGKKPKNYAG